MGGSEGGGATPSSTGMDPKVAGLLCYLLGWVTGLIFLLLEKEDRFVKFHAWQSILLFGGLTLVSFVLTSTLVLAILVPLLGIAGFALWILLMIKAYQGETFKLPFVGDFAEKQAG